MAALLEVKSDVQIAAGSTLFVTNQDGILIFENPVDVSLHHTLTINGAVSATDMATPAASFVPGGVVALYFANADVVVGATGSINLSVTAPSTNGYALYDVSAAKASFINAGHVTVSGTQVEGFKFASSVTFENDGTFTVSGPHPFGGQAQNSLTFINHGDFEVTGGPAPTGLWVVGAGEVFENSGTFREISNGQDAGLAIDWGTEDGVFTNSGLIEGDTALKVTPPFSNLSVRTQLFTNSGVIHGGIILSAETDLLHNSGAIVGDVNLGDGNDTYAGDQGSLTGLLSAGLGDDSVSGGAGFDYMNGNQGNDTLHGNAGDDWVVGGKDNDVQFGDAGADVVWGNLGNDTLDGGDGADQVRGGQGDDALNGGAGDDWLSGDRGSDTVTGGTGADIFHTFSGAGLDVVTDFNAVEGDRVMLDPGTTYAVRQQGPDTIIDMGNGDQMILQHTQLSSLPTGWIFGA